MIVEKTKLDGVYLIKPTHYEDFRGEYLQIYNDKEYKEAIPELLGVNFIEDDISITYRHNFKGIHGSYNKNGWKLISCIFGKIYVIVLDYNVCDLNYEIENKQYGKYAAFTLSDVNKYQLLVPPGFGNGHLCVSDKSIFHYKQGAPYNIREQFTICYNDDRFNIWLPVKPIVSQRDETGDKTYVKS